MNPPAAATPPTPRERLLARQKQERQLLRLRERLWEKPAGSCIRLGGYRLKITDGPNAYMQYKDEFIRGIYRFTAMRPDPLIIDGGSNMGMSILAFRHFYPEARIIGMEPDPAIFELLKRNLRINRIEGVTLVNAGLASEVGRVPFSTDGSAGGRLDEKGGGSLAQTVRLSGYLAEPVDFVKLNIEGQELPVLREVEASGRLSNVARMVLEYHGWAGGEQCLGAVLDLLNRNGFRYLVHDFDGESGPISKPPFRHRPQADWFCLVYAERVG